MEVRMRRCRLPPRWSAEIDKLMQSTWAHRVFWIGILFKALNGLVETGGGIILLIISNETIARWTYALVRPELAEDPNDWIANHVLSSVLHLSSDAKLFAIVYLLVHGIIKLVIVVAIWYSQLWAYWLAGIVFSLFVIYQMARFAVTHSLAMVFLTAIDLVIIALLPPEHRRVALHLRDRRKKPPSPPPIINHQS
jgi:uncharacterized membrane protein